VYPVIFLETRLQACKVQIFGNKKFEAHFLLSVPFSGDHCQRTNLIIQAGTRV
jgi:hypothetical protein